VTYIDNDCKLFRASKGAPDHVPQESRINELWLDISAWPC
jgi:hypothetical protein